MPILPLPTGVGPWPSFFDAATVVAYMTWPTDHAERLRLLKGAGRDGNCVTDSTSLSECQKRHAKAGYSEESVSDDAGGWIV
jgi:hypothetical protein